MTVPSTLPLTAAVHQANVDRLPKLSQVMCMSVAQSGHQCFVKHVESEQAYAGTTEGNSCLWSPWQDKGVQQLAAMQGCRPWSDQDIKCPCACFFPLRMIPAQYAKLERPQSEGSGRPVARPFCANACSRSPMQAVHCGLQCIPTANHRTPLPLPAVILMRQVHLGLTPAAVL